MPPGASVRVVGKKHPLSGHRVDAMVEAGLTIAEILERCAGSFSGGYHVTIGEHPIEARNYHRVRVKAGATVTFIPLLKNNALKSVLQVAIAVVAIVVSVAIFGPGGTLGLTGLTATIAQALAASAIILAGSWALNALFPTRSISDKSEEAQKFNSIQGAQNQANPFGAIPVVLGKHRQSPFYAAKGYTEIVGTDQYLRLLFCLGYGPLVIEDIKIGETPITSFSDYEIQVRQGFDDDDPITLYPGSVDEVGLSVELDATVDGRFQYLPGPYSTQNTAAETDEISLDFTAPQGIYATDSRGGEVSFSVTIETQYRVYGSGSGWTQAANRTLYRSIGPTRAGLRFTVARGQYEVRVRRVTSRGISQYTRDEVLWTAIRSTKNQSPISFPEPLALIALRIKATDQLSGVINTLNCVTTSLVTALSGSPLSWTAETASQNPADLFRHVLQGPANARPVGDSKIDLDNLEDWWLYCRDNGFQFNQIVSSAGPVSEKLADIASAGRAAWTFKDGKWAVIWDRPNDLIVQKFTPRNSWGFQGQRAYLQQPHGWRVKFINEDNGWTQDERIVYDDGYSSSNATLFEGIEFPGVTKPSLIWKHGRFHIAQSRLRPEKLSLSTGWENLICTKGDRVEVSHDVALIGLFSGRVKSVVGQIVTFDEQVTIESGKTYGMQFRVPADIRSITRAVDATPAGEYYSLTLVGDLAGISEGNLFSFGETDQESAIYRVQSISHQSDLVATLTLVDDAPDVSLADAGTIPSYNPNVTVPADPFTLPPRDLHYAELIDGSGAAARAIVQLIWQVPRFGNISSFEVQIQDVESGSGLWTTVGSAIPPATTFDVVLSKAGIFSFRVRCVFDDGTVSNWTSIESLNLAALSAVPADVTNLHQRAVDSQTVLDWSVVEDPRTIYYEFRKGSTWDTGLVVGDAISQPPWAPVGDGTYFLKAYILSPFGTKIYSDTATSILLSDSVVSRNIIVEKDEQVDGWTGSYDGAIIISGPFLQTDPSGSISETWAQQIINDLAIAAGSKVAIYASGSVIDIGRAEECRFWTEFEGVGVLAGADFLATTDFLAQTDVLGASPTRLVRVFPIWRFSSVGEPDAFNPADIFAETDIFTSGIEWEPWSKVAQGNRKSRFFQPGIVVISDEDSVNASATKFRWFVDVPDRTDDYTELSVPNTGLNLVFYPGGYDIAPGGGQVALPFKGGPNGATVPHVQRGLVDQTVGDEVKITNLTLAGCTVHVYNGGVAQTRSGVNLLVRGYGYA